MHRRVVLVVSTLVFALLAAATWLMTDVHDRAFPAHLGTSAVVNLDFGSSPLSDEQAFAELGTFSDRLGLGLLKLAPDLTGDQQGQVLVALGTVDTFPDSIDRFGIQADAIVRDRSGLGNSYATGQYLVTGDLTSFAEMSPWLRDNEVVSSTQADDLGTLLRFLVVQDGFVASLIAVSILLVSLVLYWLSVKARGRALRVLSGATTWRVHTEDLAGFLLPLCAAAAFTGTIGSLVLAATQGAGFVTYYASTYTLVAVVVLSLTLTGAIVMSIGSAPSAAMLAARRPAVATIRRVSVGVKGLTFVVVLASIAPAFHALDDARLVAAQQSKWRSLSDQVAMTFPAGTGEDGIVALMPKVGSAIADAERIGGVALSYTWTGDQSEGVGLEADGPVALINQSWVDLVIGDDTGKVVDAEAGIPAGFRTFLDESLPLWVRVPSDAATWPEWITVISLSDPAGIPLSSGGGGGLVFPDSATLLVADRPAERFNDDFLTSLASTSNLVFDGLGPTEQLLDSHGLAGAVQLRLVAEEGVLAAQVAEYTAWLRTLSLVALMAALALSAIISAFVSSLLSVRRDFPLRLAGRSWWEILSGRVLRETAVGAVLIGLVALGVGGADVLLVLTAGVLALLAAPLAHLGTARWAFAHARGRRL